MTEEIKAHEIKQAYTKKIRLTHPYYEAKSEESFLKAAKICMGLKAHAKVYVDAIFAWAKARSIKDVFPTYLHMSKAIDAYNEYIAESYIPPEELIDVYKKYVEEQLIDVGRELENILLDDKLDLPAWFRIVASREVIPSVLAKYRIKARDQMDQPLRDFLEKNNFDHKRI